MHRITSAPEPLAEDIARRTHRYLVQMGIRLVCFLAAVLLWPYIPRLLSLLLILGAIVLPYVAVIFANAGRERADGPSELVGPRTIGPGPTRDGGLPGPDQPARNDTPDHPGPEAR